MNIRPRTKTLDADCFGRLKLDEVSSFCFILGLITNTDSCMLFDKLRQHDSDTTVCDFQTAGKPGLDYSPARS